MSDRNRDNYSELEEKTFRLFIIRDLEDNDAAHERLKRSIHEWVDEFKKVNTATNDRVTKLTGIFYSLLVAVTIAVIVAATTGLMR